MGAVGEKVVGFMYTAERVAVGYQMGSVNLTFGDELHDFVAVAGIDATGLERQVLAIHPRQGQYLPLLIERDNRDDGIRTGASPCQFKRILSTGYLDDAVGATALS